MERNQEFRHVCKFCSKSFLCGRSLGGHMRSHMINDISAQTDGTKITKKKLPPLSHSSGAAKNNNTSNDHAGNHGLRENQKKTWRLDDHSSEHTSVVADKSCRKCGKGFQSWKALFGHMKRHSPEKERVSNNNSMEEQQDSWTSADNQKLVIDSHSDNEAGAPNRRKRSKRRVSSTAITNSCSFTFANNDHSSSVSEIEQEQEEVAMSLMMLSKDVGHWGVMNYAAESSDNNSVFLKTNGDSSKKEGKTSLCNGIERVEVLRLEFDNPEYDEDFKVESGNSEFSASGIVKNDMRRLDDSSNRNLMKENGLSQTESALTKSNSSKRKMGDSFHLQLRSDSIKKNMALDFETCHKSERSGNRFKCATCNKVFHSYKALGGHRASHKKMKGCFDSRLDSFENSIETTDPTTYSDVVAESIDDQIPNYHMATDCDNKAETGYEAKKSRHECPICLKVFSSGQALGGHKRSHSVGDVQAKNNRTVAIQEQIPVIRDFLDLNLPAPGEEESSRCVGFDPWWIGSNHKHQALVGLISN